MATSSKLFSFSDVKNKPSRSGFDLSRRLAFTAKISELLPVCVIKTFPGDSFTIKTQHFTRTAPVQTAAFVRIREYFDWFFVPYRMLWKQWQSMSTNMLDQPVIARGFTENAPVSQQQPHIMLRDLLDRPLQGFTIGGNDENYFGLSRTALFGKLFNYFGYGRVNWCSEQVLNTSGDPAYGVPNLLNMPVDIFPIAAYHKVYNDYFRNSQWEAQSPYLWNFQYSNGGVITLPNPSDDYWNGKTFFDMEYCNVPKDLFFGVLPQSQLGDVANVPVPLDSEDNVVPVELPSRSVYVGQQNIIVDGPSGSTTVANVASGSTDTSLLLRPASALTPIAGKPIKTTGGNYNIPSGVGSLNLEAISAQFSILQLRQAEFLQRYKEIAQSGDQSYRDQVYKVWGVSLPDSLADTCTWIDGGSSNIDISEVLNTNFSDAYNEDGSPVSEPYIKGKGVGVGESSFRYETKEHGVILCLYHAQPILDYDISGIDLQLTQTEWSDYPNPAFDKIGFEALPAYAFFNGDNLPKPSDGSIAELGYVPRYISAKTAVDRVVGGFSFGLNDWVAPIDDEYINAYISAGNRFEINYNFFKINPSLLDNIFGLASNSYVETDHFRVNAYFDVKSVRNFDYNGLPY